MTKDAANTTDMDLERLALASAWRVALTEAGAASSEDFEAWLAADGRNGEAWAQVEKPWAHFEQHATAPEMMAARRDALERAPRHQQRRFRQERLNWSPAAIAASLAAAVLIGGMGGFAAWRSTQPDIYETAPGELRTITLADGSKVALDANTLLRVKLRRDRRDLELVRGQARFDVAHDKTRPFSVHARSQTVVAMGTSFNIDLFGAKVLVTLLEGRVSVLQDAAASPTRAAPPEAKTVIAQLTTGQQLVADDGPASALAVSPEPVAHVQRVSLERTTSWESGQLIFDDEPLSSVAERISRYSAQAVMVDGSAGRLKISGVFNTGDLQTFVDTVERAMNLSARQSSDGSIHLAQKAEKKG